MKTFASSGPTLSISTMRRRLSILTDALQFRGTTRPARPAKLARCSPQSTASSPAKTREAFVFPAANARRHGVKVDFHRPVGLGYTQKVLLFRCPRGYAAFSVASAVSQACAGWDFLRSAIPVWSSQRVVIRSDAALLLKRLGWSVGAPLVHSIHLGRPAVDHFKGSSCPLIR